ncbi:MAG: MCE family protein [Fibrobacteraceae bacterium]|nr:MCE family protein [Fibrobacteraceae bacterium]
MSGLSVGVIFTIAIMIFAFTLYAKLFASGMFVEEYTLHSNFEKALGLRPGTRVQISGVDVGQISNMEVTSSGVRMEFTIQRKYQSWITDSATVFAIRDQNVISARVINIEIQQGKGHILEDGDYLPPGKAQDIETVLETANQLLARVNELIDAADTLVAMAMDTGTTVGALFGSRLLYDNLNRQLNRLDDITYTGKMALGKADELLDTLKQNVPPLFNQMDRIADDVSTMLTDLKPLPGKVDNMFGKLDTTMVKVDGLVDGMGNMMGGLQDFMVSTEATLESADELMSGISNMWIIRRSIPKKDSVPFVVETLYDED